MKEIIKSKLTNIDLSNALVKITLYGGTLLLINKALNFSYNVSVDFKNLKLEFTK